MHRHQLRAYLAGRQYGISDDHFLPHRIGNVALLGSLVDSDFRCYAEVRQLEKDSVEFYFEIVDQAHKPVLIVDTISLRRVARQTIQRQAVAAKMSLAVEVRSSAAGVGPAMEKVAIIGVACRYPMSENADAFWSNLKAGRDCVTEVPADRWNGSSDWYNADPRHPHTSYSKWGGFLDNIDSFDAFIIRTTWDYAEKPDLFLSTLSRIAGRRLAVY